ncbi:MAG: ABC transporter ATP-binding protein, partial [Pseudomonadota bacterium]
MAFPIETAGASRAAARDAAGTHLQTVGLSAFAARRPAELSGGQRQRVALARCLASEARAVLMDEPLANLDPHLRGTMEAELRAFHDQSGATTLYITHDQREAMTMADRIVVLRGGVIQQVGTPDALFERPANRFVAGFIGTPAMNFLPVAVADTGGRTVESAALPDPLAGAAEIGVRPQD